MTIAFNNPLEIGARGKTLHLVFLALPPLLLLLRRRPQPQSSSLLLSLSVSLSVAVATAVAAAAAELCGPQTASLEFHCRFCSRSQCALAYPLSYVLNCRYKFRDNENHTSCYETHEVSQRSQFMLIDGHVKLSASKLHPSILHGTSSAFCRRALSVGAATPRRRRAPRQHRKKVPKLSLPFTMPGDRLVNLAAPMRRRAPQMATSGNPARLGSTSKAQAAAMAHTTNTQNEASD